VLVRPLRGGGLDYFQVIYSDEAGITNAARADISRAMFRRQLKDLLAMKPPAAITLSREEAREQLSRAARWSLDAGNALSAEAQEILRAFAVDVTKASADVPIPPPEPDDERTATRGHSLHDLPELYSWLPSESVLATLAGELDQITKSPLHLNESQRNEQMGHRFAIAARTHFTPEVKRRYGLRLWEMATYLVQTGRPEAAQVARAEARRLYHDAAGLFSPFALRLFEKVLDLTRKLHEGEKLPEPGRPAARPDEKKSPGGLILP
jgi:hypothetical protein